VVAVSDTLRDAAENLVDVEADDFDSDEAYREWIDSRLAEIEAAASAATDRADANDDRLDVHEARADALSAKAERAIEKAENAEERAKEAELKSTWGGLAYEERIERVLSEVIQRARASGGNDWIATSEEVRQNEQADRYHVPGVFDLFSGAVSKRTCRNSIDDLATLDGLGVKHANRGGWGGGSSNKRLTIDLSEFVESYAADWTTEEIVDDMGEDDA
jgi:hypothetical protein